MRRFHLHCDGRSAGWTRESPEGSEHGERRDFGGQDALLPFRFSHTIGQAGGPVKAAEQPTEKVDGIELSRGYGEAVQEAGAEVSERSTMHIKGRDRVARGEEAFVEAAKGRVGTMVSKGSIQDHQLAQGLVDQSSLFECSHVLFQVLVPKGSWLNNLDTTVS